ncbi:MAG TPA: class I SAM-dependent methyltransferase [Methanofastidiosum sp.]|nr:class I SAM-dependent methyltransferase [Methanofastidiosum sp.]HNU61405.1 class I SAM-dependent methyltransferase [Methanofastidiosum sp.]HOI77754.1 class I SAM-dependent methyltransferase [Methanofastidiosum sp.]
MGKQDDKKHWYDGGLYKYMIDPSTDDARKIISSLIENDSKVIDVGCGTGSLAFYLSEKCRYILGIELSKKMVDYANSRKKENSILNVQFFHGNAEKVSELTKDRFDYAIFSLCLHEMKSETRVKSLEEIKKVADKIIIYDYLVKEKISFKGVMNSAAEFLAGRSHFYNYKSFLEEKDIFGLLENNGFKVEKTISDKDAYMAVKARWK